MKIHLNTTYTNVTAEFLEFYIGELKKHGVPINYEKFAEGDLVAMDSGDPTGPTHAVTTYRLDREDDKA